MAAMRRKRMVRIAFLVCSILFLLWLYLHLTNGGPSLTQTQLAQIQVGMSRDQVTDILGPPNGRLSDPNVLTWVRKSEQAVVYLDNNGCVRNKELYDSSMDPWWIRAMRMLFLPAN
jgi:hypothetical protein